MKSNIDDLCDAFIAAITDVGYASKNIENYKQVSNRFKKFCAENDYDTYTANIGQMFADNVFNEKTGELVRYRYVMYGRFVRLINSFYLQGTFDFSMVKEERNLPTSTQLIELYQNYTKHLKVQYLLHFRFSNCYLDKIQQHCVEKKFKVLGSAGELQIIITCLEFNHTIWRTDDFARLNV